ncbi:MAG: D-alanyl-D-alanine carboxypeptidase family protein, partial [Actinomycetota bacterium]
MSARRLLPCMVALALMAVGVWMPSAPAALSSAAPASALPALPGLSPIQLNNSPTPIAGQVNGELAQSQLIEVEPNCLAARAAAPSLALLFTRANAAGISLSATICYRPLSDQIVQRSSACSEGNCACAAPLSVNQGGAVGGTSNHGWGKAIDFRTAAGPVTSFSSSAYLWLKANAGRYGWNEPAAEAPGATCPEPWHWEWVGDGGTLGASPVTADVVSMLAAANGNGYLTVTGLGKITPHGDDRSLGGADQLPLNRLVVGAAPTPDGAGYWLVASDGGIFTYGDAGFFGSAGSIRLNKPIVGMVPTASGRGYWMVASDGGIFTYGDAPFLGSLGSTRISGSVVG